MKSHSGEQRPQTDAETAHQRFRGILGSGRLQAGQFVTQKELLALLGVSLGPMRAALVRLETEGYLHILPQRGIQIVEPTLERFREVLQMRIALEKEAWAKFAVTGSEADIDTFLDKNHAFAVRAQESAPEALFREISAYDRTMHGAVVDHMHNSIISNQFRIARELSWSLRQDKGVVRHGNMDITLSSHIKILTACKKRDTAAVVNEVEQHLMNGMLSFFV